MKPYDSTVIVVHEKILQWIWDHFGISRCWAIRIVGGATVLIEFICDDGSALINPYVFALAVVLAQGIDEIYSSLYGKNNNFRILQTREQGYISIIRLLFVSVLVLTLPLNIHSSHYLEISSDIFYLMFLYFLESKEPVEPPRFFNPELQHAPTRA